MSPAAVAKVTDLHVDALVDRLALNIDALLLEELSGPLITRRLSLHLVGFAREKNASTLTYLSSDSDILLYLVLEVSLHFKHVLGISRVIRRHHVGD